MSPVTRFTPPPALRTRLEALYAEPHRLLDHRELQLRPLARNLSFARNMLSYCIVFARVGLFVVALPSNAPCVAVDEARCIRHGLAGTEHPAGFDKGPCVHVTSLPSSYDAGFSLRIFHIDFAWAGGELIAT
jgi:hypothetical protein